MKYGTDAPPINLITDGCMTGIAGLVSQGDDWKTAPIADFYSAKLNSAQQNYAVHEIELLAGVETMLRHRNILQGTRFRWFTDHKGLVHLLRQKNLTGRQARWIEKISEFDFEIVYVPGSTNVLADALSRIYSYDEPGTVRSKTEYTEYDETRIPRSNSQNITTPLTVGLEARATFLQASKNPKETAKQFAKRIKRVVLKVNDPKERQKGESGGTTLKNSEANSSLSESQPQQEVQPNSRRELPNSERLEFPDADLSDRDLSSVAGGSRGFSGDFRPEMNQTEQLQDWLNPGLIDVIAEGKPGFEFPQCLKGRYVEDKFFELIVQRPDEFKNFEVKDDLVFIKTEGRKLLCIPRVLIEGRSAQEIIISHAHSILAHLGTYKTITYLRDHVWWRDLNSDVQRYCETCEVCKRSKPPNKKPYGLLNPLSVPTRPWEAIGIDFMGPLPDSKNRDGTFDMITVIIDLLTGMVHVVPSRQNFKAKQIAELIFEHVYKLHGLPKAIISDRDSLFTSTFWRKLHELIGIELKFSSAYHPETDGSTE